MEKDIVLSVAVETSENYLMTTLNGSREHSERLLKKTGDIKRYQSLQKYYDNLEEAIAEVSEAFLNDYHRTKHTCLLYTSPSPRDRQKSRMPSSA